MSRKKRKAEEHEIRQAIHRMIDSISDRSILIRAYTFIKYLR